MTLNGKISGKISLPIKYTLPLTEPSGISLSCTLSDNKSECETDKVINNKILIIPKNIALNDGTTFIISEFSTQEIVKCTKSFVSVKGDNTTLRADTGEKNSVIFHKNGSALSGGVIVGIVIATVVVVAAVCIVIVLVKKGHKKAVDESSIISSEVNFSIKSINI